MPELPEVETIRRGLTKFIKAKKITRIEIFCDKSMRGPDGAESDFVATKSLIEGQKIIGLDRRGKALLVNLENGITMMIHLRMTGQLIFRKKDFAALHDSSAPHSESSKLRYADGKISDEDSFAGGHPSDNFLDELPNKQTRVVFEFDDGGKLFFNDQRKFGFVKLIPTSEIEDDEFIKKLAPEPWDISLKTFERNCLKHKNSCIKATILDQSTVAGVGNIYADEALFASGIHPETLSGNLRTADFERLLKNIAKVMDASINSGGSTMATYVRADGSKGDYLEKFAQVFRREGQPCLKCGTEIIKTKVAGRGTHICPNCQPKLPSSARPKHVRSTQKELQK